MAKSLSVIALLVIATLVAAQENTTTENESYTYKSLTSPDGDKVISNVKKVTSKVETMTKDGQTVVTKNETTTIDDRDEEEEVEEDPVKWCAVMFKIAENFQQKWAEYVKDNAEDLKGWASDNLNITELAEFSQEAAEDFVLKWGNFMLDPKDVLVDLANNITHNNNNTWSDFVQGLTCAFAEKFGEFIKDNTATMQDWSKDIKEGKGGKWLADVLKFAKEYTKDWREYIKEDAKHLNDDVAFQSPEGSMEKLRQLAIISSGTVSRKLAKFAKENSESLGKWYEMLKKAGAADETTEKFTALVKEATQGNADKLVEFITENSESIAQNLKKAVLLGGDTAKQLSQKWVELIKECSSEVIGESIDALSSDLPENTELLGDSVKENADKIKDWVSTIQKGGAPSDLSENTVELIKKALADKGDTLKKALEGDPEKVVSFFKNISQGLVSDEQIEQFTDLLKKAAATGSTEEWNKLMESGSGKLKEWFKTLAEVDSDGKSEGLVESLKQCAQKSGKFDEMLTSNVDKLREYFKGVSTDDAEPWVLALKEAANSDPEKFSTLVKENTENLKEFFKNMSNVDAAEWILLLKEAANSNPAGFDKLVQENSGKLKDWFKSMSLGDTLKQLVQGGVEKLQGIVSGAGAAGASGANELLKSANVLGGNNLIGNALSDVFKLVGSSTNNKKTN